MRISLQEAAHLLNTGSVVAVPTETVYGLAARIDHPEAIQRIFALKGRPRTNPLIIHVADAASVLPFTSQLPPHFDTLAETFWPGPLTLVIPVNDTVPSLVRANLPTAAFRVPHLPITRQLIEQTGPLVMPSANLSGRPSSTSPEHVEADFGVEFPVFDGGVCSCGLESTILLYQGDKWVIGRLGALPQEALTPLLGYTPPFLVPTSTPLCPGQLHRHYAPIARLLLSDKPQKADYTLGFTDRHYPLTQPLISLGPSNDPETIASNLYNALRTLDTLGAHTAWVDTNFPHTGLWQTINERLRRAAER